MNAIGQIIRSAIVASLLTPLLAACASNPARADSAKLALYRSHAGAPVQSFQFFGHLDSWTPLGDSAVVVWTRPNQAWLLDLYGPCNGLDFTVAIGLTSSAGRVSARFDKVLVRDVGRIELPCTIAGIRPVDVPAVKAAERDARAEAKAQASGT